MEAIQVQSSLLRSPLSIASCLISSQIFFVPEVSTARASVFCTSVIIVSPLLLVAFTQALPGATEFELTSSPSITH